MQLIYQAFAFTGLITGTDDHILLFGDKSYNKDIIEAIINSKHYKEIMKSLKEFTDYATLHASNTVISGVWTEKKLYKDNYEEIRKGIAMIKNKSHTI